MHVAFIDPVNWQYAVDAPFDRPFGGSQSALCYLAVELARTGHVVTLINGSSQISHQQGVRVCPLGSLGSREFIRGIDVVVVLNGVIGCELRKLAGADIPLVLWNQHSYDQPAVQPLLRGQEREAWDAIVFVSEWQRGHFERLFAVTRERSTVLRNAVAPPFVANKAPTAWYRSEKPPVFFYSSTPFRGLDLLLEAFRVVHAAVPAARLRVFSSMSVYQVAGHEDPFTGLYELCRTTPGVEYVGSLGQARLAVEIAGAAALTYPSTFEETSCIAALEAMAIGATVLSTDIGALPETTAGFARTCSLQASKEQLVQSYAELVIGWLEAVQQDPSAQDQRRAEQMQFVRDHYTWPKRAPEWAQFLHSLI
jgi:glycosyltransferase involved in cell wall biosynthesis